MLTVLREASGIRVSTQLLLCDCTNLKALIWGRVCLIYNPANSFRLRLGRTTTKQRKNRQINIDGSQRTGNGWRGFVFMTGLRQLSIPTTLHGSAPWQTQPLRWFTIMWIQTRTYGWCRERESPRRSLVASKRTTHKGSSALSVIYCLCTLCSIINVHCVAKFMCCLCPPPPSSLTTHPALSYRIKAQERLEYREHWVTSWKTAMIMWCQRIKLDPVILQLYSWYCRKWLSLQSRSRGECLIMQEADCCRPHEGMFYLNVVLLNDMRKKKNQRL